MRESACRVWTYDRPAVVLGCSQRGLRDRVEQRLQGRAELAVRDSGGGAVLAGPWLVSVSVVLPHAHPWARDGTIEAYRRLAEVHVAALAQIGVAARAVAPRELPRADGAGATAAADWACFAGVSPWEVVDATGRKLVGVAQRRCRSGVLLVAGTLIGAADWRMLCDALDHPQHASALRERTTCVEELLGRAIEPRRFAGALMRSLKCALAAQCAGGRCVSSASARSEKVRFTATAASRAMAQRRGESAGP